MTGGDAELVPLAFEEQLAGVDRLRARALVLPELTASDLREPIGDGHPLRVAARIAALGGMPADPASVERFEEAVFETAPEEATRPHDDPDPARRIARRILQRLNGMGKWGGYHTEFTHLARGLRRQRPQARRGRRRGAARRRPAAAKPSVGQRHVFLNPRRAADIHALIERGVVPPGLRLP